MNGNSYLSLGANTFGFWNDFLIIAAPSPPLKYNDLLG